MTTPMLLEKLTQQVPQGHPVVSGGGGVLVEWKVAHGQHVRKDDLIAEVQGVGWGITSPIPAAADGILHHAKALKAIVQANETIGYIAPAQEPVKRATPIAPPQHTAPAPKTQQAPSGEASASPEEPAADTPRRSTMSDPDELVAVEELTLPTPPKPRPRETIERPRIVKWMWHPLDREESAIRRSLTRLTKRGFDYQILELQRLASGWLASLPEEELIERIEAQRDREVAERYGYGLSSRRTRRTRK